MKQGKSLLVAVVWIHTLFMRESQLLKQLARKVPSNGVVYLIQKPLDSLSIAVFDGFS